MIDQSRRFGTLYKVIGSRLYRSDNCAYPSRCASVEELLLNIVRDLPDLEFVLNVRDWPQIHFLSGLSGPVFSYSSTDNFLDIMCPAWSFWTSAGPLLQQYPRGLGRWDHMRRFIADRARRMPWQKKISIGFFRGSRSSKERDNLVLLTKRAPHLVDAQYTQSKNSPVKEMSLAEHCKFKYLFNFRGISASFRLRHILLCKSLVLHVGQEWQEFFYSSLKPWIHYVPVGSNASEEDLEGLILYLRQHDDLAEEIAERGFQFVWQQLRMKDILCYWRQLLQEYAKLLSYNVEMELKFHEVLPRTAIQLYYGKI
ncbi:uncharacterized protein Dwil_GK11623 [Drosophila willistoni]|uniref:Glycosyl transferase CAP10 domain-containing protein n=2 Tax=Drosophila willistoni TaxID=7260 RepID=B4N9P8_DROWI|nr:uncharacterized protein Dwil_GK11623 [Drosophila willistoni]